MANRLAALEATGKGRWSSVPLTWQAILILGLAIGPLAVSVVLLGVTSRRDAALDRAIVEHRDARVLETEILKDMVDAETGVRGFLLTQNPAFLEPYERATAEVPELFERLHEHTSQDRHNAVAQLRELAKEQLRLLSELVSDNTSVGSSEPRLLEAKAAMDDFRKAMADVTADEDRQISELLEERDDRARSTLATLMVGGAASAVGVALGGMLLILGVVRRLRIVTDNARRVAEGEELEPVHGRDKIAQLASELRRSAQLLRARQSELYQAKEEADRANSAKSDFISRMSHELRTPLNAILGFAQILREDADERTSEDVAQILRAGRHLLTLINEVLDLSRIESGQFAISLEPVAVSEVVQECVELVGPLAGSRRISITNNITRDDELHVTADRQRLKQVLLNLLSNAIKYNKEEGQVLLSCSIDGSRVRLEVRDTGPGVPEGDRDQLFTAFARLGAEATEIEGTGLGLALSVRLMQMMGGELELGDTGPSGSEFWVELEAVEAATGALVERAAGGPAPRRTIGEAAAITILQVEDNPTNIRLMERILGRRPHVELVTVTRGEEAVSAAKRARPTIILLDVNLPDISGRDVLVVCGPNRRRPTSPSSC